MTRDGREQLNEEKLYKLVRELRGHLRAAVNVLFPRANYRVPLPFVFGYPSPTCCNSSERGKPQTPKHANT